MWVDSLSDFQVLPEGLLDDDAILACLTHEGLLGVLGGGLINGAGQSQVEGWPVALGGRWKPQSAGQPCRLWGQGTPTAWASSSGNLYVSRFSLVKLEAMFIHFFFVPMN